MRGPLPLLPLLRASHFQPTVAVTAIATALAVAVGRRGGALWVGAAVLSGQLSVGWSNDWLDRDRDRRAGRLDKPVASGEVAAGTVGLAAALAAAACVPLSLASGWRAGLLHLGEVAAAWGYNAGLKGTVLSPLPYALAFGALPAFVTLGLPGHPLPPAWAWCAAALLGVGAHFVNTLPDLEEDARAGVRGLPHRLGRDVSLLVGAALLAAAAVVVALAPSGGPGPVVGVLAAAALAAVVGVVVEARAGRERRAWTLTLCTAVITVVLLLAQGPSLA